MAGDGELKPETGMWAGRPRSLRGADRGLGALVFQADFFYGVEGEGVEAIVACHVAAAFIGEVRADFLGRGGCVAGRR
jgi:hypothetical protein